MPMTGVSKSKLVSAILIWCIYPKNPQYIEDNFILQCFIIISVNFFGQSSNEVPKIFKTTL